MIFFIRKGKLLPIGPEILNTKDYSVENLTLLGDGEEYELYTDDGLTRDCRMENVRILHNRSDK